MVVQLVKNSHASAEDTRDMCSISGLERSPGVENGNLLQYSCLENFMNRRAWWAAVHGVTKSQTELKRLSRYTCTLRIETQDRTKNKEPWSEKRDSEGFKC